MSGGRGDPLVLGGGVAGAAVATLLARAGERVTLVEQHAEPRDKVCGEFLSAEACASLLWLGMEVRRLGAVPVGLVRMAGRGGLAECALPFEAWSVTRRVLDEAMLEMAAESGVEVRRGERVERLEEDAGGWRVRMSGGEVMDAGPVFVASGKHDLRGHARVGGSAEGLIAFKQYFRLAEEQRAELDGAIELMLFRGGYGGLEMVEGGCANLCVLVEARRYREVGGSWEAVLGAIADEVEHVARRLCGAEAMLERPLSLSRIPYGFLRREPGLRGLWYVGDQAAVIPSFSGDGMSIALHTAAVAAEVYLQGMGAQALTRRLGRELGGLMTRAVWISRWMLDARGQRVLGAGVRAMPWLLRGGAAVTRVPVRARRAVSLG